MLYASSYDKDEGSLPLNVGHGELSYWPEPAGTRQ
jgi:hypothetical protein